MEYYSVIIKNAIMPFEITWMDLEVFTLSGVSQTEKDKFHMISLVCGIQFFKWHKMNLFTKQKQTYRYQTNKLNGYQMGNLGEGGINQVLGMNIYSLLYIW